MNGLYDLDVKDIQKKMFACVRAETMKVNQDVFGIDWVN